MSIENNDNHGSNYHNNIRFKGEEKNQEEKRNSFLHSPGKKLLATNFQEFIFFIFKICCLENANKYTTIYFHETAKPIIGYYRVAGSQAKTTD